MPSSHDIPRIPLRTVGPYQLTAQLGQSTHGPAYVARIPGNDTVFALKWFQRRIPPEEVARIRQEIQIVSRLNHPGIVVPVDFGLEKDRLYVVSEHVEGSTAQERLSTHGPMDSKDAARLVADLADALERAHQAGILHRDLKPANVVIDPRNRGKVLDLGLGPSVSAAGTNTTPYQAPEQIRGERPGVRTDVYALGAILYELLCCRPPYSGRSTQELADTILAGQLIPPSRLTAGIHSKVESICLGALAQNPRKRPASAAAMAKSLRRAAEGKSGGVPVVLAGLLALIWALSLAIPITLALRYRTTLERVQDRANEHERALEAQVEGLEQTKARLESQVQQAENAQRRVRDERDRATDQVRDLTRKWQELQEQALRLEQTNQRLSVQSLDPTGQTALVLDQVIELLAQVEDTRTDRMRVDLLRIRGRYQESATLAGALQIGDTVDYDLLMSQFLSAILGQSPEQVQAVAPKLQQAPEGSPAREFFALSNPTASEEQSARDAVTRRVLEQGTTGNRYLDLYALLAFLATGNANPQALQQGLVLSSKLLPHVLKDAPLEPSCLQAAVVFYAAQARVANQQQKQNHYLERMREMAHMMRLARELQPTNLDLIVSHAEQFLQLGQPSQAAGLFEVAIRSGDRMGRSDVRNQARIGKGTALLMLKQAEEGLREWKSVLGTFGSTLQPAEQSLVLKVALSLQYVPKDRLQAFIERDIPTSASQAIKSVLAQLQKLQQQRR
ncbi:MAG: protein kinase [Planctomycetota bacterium]